MACQRCNSKDPSGSLEYMRQWVCMLHRLSILVAVATLALILTGACLTSIRGAPPGAISTPDGNFVESIHLGLSVVVGVLITCLSIWMLASGNNRGLSWIALAVTVADGGLGHQAGVASLSVVHAVLAQILLGVLVAISVCTSRGWALGADPVADHGWPSLRSMAVMAPVVVLAQIALGAGFRHKTSGLTWHIVGAMVTSLLILIVGMCVMQSSPKHRALRPAAIALLSVTLVQVLLGITALTAEMMAPDNTVPLSALLAAVAHVATGALTLAASLVLSIQIRRNVQTAVEEPEQDAAATS